ncbi:MAG: hypothetical protein QOE70_491 [Chthoniobacter sp.]|jgi:hypothetical protein|nr:hypothetical protein [Chthoniobacter sp.]
MNEWSTGKGPLICSVNHVAFTKFFVSPFCPDIVDS